MSNRYFLGIYDEDMTKEEERFLMERVTNGRMAQKLVTSSTERKSKEKVISMWESEKLRGEVKHRLFVIMHDGDPKKRQVSEVKKRPTFD